MERLLDVIDRRDGVGVATVLADGGFGKSRLLEEVRRASDRPSVTVRVDETPIEPFQWIRLLLRELGVGWVPDVETLSPGERRWEVANVLEEALSAAGPVLVIIDDIHRAEDDAVAILERAVEGRSGSWALAVAARLGYRPVLEPLIRAGVVVELGPLSERSVAVLVDSLGIALASDEVMAITGGSPLLIDELARAGDHGVRGLDILRLRIEGLPAETRRLLGALSLDPEAPHAVLSAALGVDSTELDEHREPARKGRVLDDRNRFVHDLVREAARRPAEVPDLHRALADAWSSFDSLDGRIEACRHRVHAIPSTDPEVVVEDAVALADELTSGGRPEAARAILVPLLDAVSEHLPGRHERRARALVSLSDARWELGDQLQSVALGVQASDIALETGDVGLRARAELAATRKHDTIQPDLDRLDRVLGVVEALPRDEPIRARLLGRAAVLAMTALEIERAHRLADEGLELAKALEDPELEGQLLSDRHLSVVDRPGAEARERVGERMIGLAAQSPRSELALIGHQWIAGTRMLRGDLAGAAVELDRLEIRAALRPPPWQLVVRFRRMALAGMTGPREAALDLADDTWERFGDLLGEQERPGVEHEYRSSLVRLYGIEDPEVERLHETLFEQPLPPVPFINVRAGMRDLMVGDLDRVAPVVERWAPRSRAIVRSFMGLPTAAALATMAAAVAEPEACRSVADALLPFSGLLASDNGIGVNPPVDTLIAMNLLAAGDVAGAERHAVSGVDLADKSGAAPLLARALSVRLDVMKAAGEDRDDVKARFDAVARRAGLAPSETNGSPRRAQATGRFARDGGEWRVDCPFGSGTVAHTRGMGQLVAVIAARGAEVPAVTLAGSDVPAAFDLGPKLDAAAKRAYRRRIADLEAQAEEARRFNDPKRAELAEVELDAILSELRSAVGLGGRDRPQGSGHERARVNVTRSIRRAIDAITDVMPDLGAHLSVSINTGRSCVYLPDPAAAIDWEVVA